ncbi:MAG: SDR family NAD(P)-dependent oxidoreductase [Ignavibacteria bacterium]|nr:SDR family NAD(P)-dependent oxidoreductase [Ignavibacteria bacterium]
MKDLKDKVVFITGATSGIGRSAAFKFAESGCKLILAARRKERLDSLQSELMEKFGVDVITMVLDVRNYSEVDKAVSELHGEWTKIEVLLNNAGLARGFSKVHEGSLDDWNEMIDTNVKGLLFVSKCVIPIMVKNNSGHVINVGSIAGHEVYPNGNVYCASKHAVDAITKGMRMDLTGTAVRVTTIDPGLVETEFGIVRYRGDADKAKTAYVGMKPLSPDDVADAIIYSATRDENVVVAQIVLLPVAQASAMVVYREN